MHFLDASHEISIAIDRESLPTSIRGVNAPRKSPHFDLDNGESYTQT